MNESVSAIIDFIGIIIDSLGNMMITEHLSLLTFLVIMAIVVLVVSWLYQRWTQ